MEKLSKGQIGYMAGVGVTAGCSSIMFLGWPDLISIIILLIIGIMGLSLAITNLNNTK